VTIDVEPEESSNSNEESYLVYQFLVAHFGQEDLQRITCTKHNIPISKDIVLDSTLKDQAVLILQSFSESAFGFVVSEDSQCAVLICDPNPNPKTIRIHCGVPVIN
jgi:hypothetical protein